MRNIDSGKEGFWIDSCAYARPLHDVRQYALIHVNGNFSEEQLKDKLWQEYVN